MRYWMLSLCAVAALAFGFSPVSSASEFRGETSITEHGHGGGWGHRGGGRGWGHGGRHYNGDGYGCRW